MSSMAPEHHVAAGHPRRGDGPHGGDPLHHPPAVDLPGSARVLGEHPLDHLGGVSVIDAHR